MYAFDTRYSIIWPCKNHWLLAFCSVLVQQPSFVILCLSARNCFLSQPICQRISGQLGSCLHLSQRSAQAGCAAFFGRKRWSTKLPRWLQQLELFINMVKTDYQLLRRCAIHGIIETLFFLDIDGQSLAITIKMQTIVQPCVQSFGFPNVLGDADCAERRWFGCLKHWICWKMTSENCGYLLFTGWMLMNDNRSPFPMTNQQ